MTTPRNITTKGLRRARSAHLRRLLLVALAVVVLVVSTCGGDAVPLRGDAQLLQRAQQVIREGTDPVLFRTIAPGDWDRVHVFPGPPDPQIIEDVFDISLDVAKPYARYHRGGILIFATGGLVTRAVLLEPSPFDGNGGSYGPSVTVSRAHPDAESLSFTDLSMLRATRCGRDCSVITRLPPQWDFRISGRKSSEEKAW